MKLFDSELKIMDALWREGNLSASQLVKCMENEIGWNKNTTYTVIKKCVEKGAIRREDPNYVCIALIGKEEVQKEETDELINKLFEGSADLFFTRFLKSKKLSKKEIEQLKNTVEELKGW